MIILRKFFGNFTTVLDQKIKTCSYHFHMFTILRWSFPQDNQSVSWKFKTQFQGPELSKMVCFFHGCDGNPKYRVLCLKLIWYYVTLLFTWFIILGRPRTIEMINFHLCNIVLGFFKNGVTLNFGFPPSFFIDHKAL